jgi:hypothetical protein
MNPSLLSRYAKAVVGFVAPGAVIIGASVTSASDGGTAITTAELVTALVACVVTSAGVALKGNADPEREHPLANPDDHVAGP